MGHPLQEPCHIRGLQELQRIAQAAAAQLPPVDTALLGKIARKLPKRVLTGSPMTSFIIFPTLLWLALPLFSLRWNEQLSFPFNFVTRTLS